MEQIIHEGGAIERIKSKEEKDLRAKFKDKKEAKDLSDADVKELVLAIAKQLKII